MAERNRKLVRVAAALDSVFFFGLGTRVEEEEEGIILWTFIAVAAVASVLLS